MTRHLATSAAAASRAGLPSPTGLHRASENTRGLRWRGVRAQSGVGLPKPGPHAHALGLGRRGLPATSSPVPAGSSSRTPACGYQTVGNDHGSTGLDSRSTLSHVPQACTERPRTQGGSACGACVLSQVSVSLSLVHTHTPLGSCTANLSAAPQLAPGVGKGAAGALPPSPAPVHPSALPDSRERPSDKTRRQHLPYICEEKT